jgi:hypothetical protein
LSGVEAALASACQGYLAANHAHNKLVELLPVLLPALQADLSKLTGGALPVSAGALTTDKSVAYLAYLSAAAEGEMLHCASALLAGGSGAASQASIEAWGGAAPLPAPAVTRGVQDLPEPDPSLAPLTTAMPKESALLQVGV